MEVQDPLKSPTPPPSSPPQGQDHEAGATALMDEDKQRPPQGKYHEAGATALMDEDKQRNTSTNNIHELSDEAYDVIRETTNEYEELIPNEYEELATNENKGNMSLGNEGLETNENEESVTIENEEPVTNESKDRRKSKIALRSSPKPKAMIRIFLWRMHTFFQKVIIRCVKIAPVIIGFIVFCLMIFDQGTDINSTRQICTVQCKCVWKNATKECEGPGDARRNGDECYAAFGNKDLIQNYCGSATNKTACDGADGLLTWRPGNLRHPKYCGFSATTILLPNLVNSIYLLYSLWCIRGEVSDYTRIPNNVLSKIIFLIIFIAQLFPHTWVFMSFLIKLNRDVFNKPIFKEYTDKWELPGTRAKIVFNVMEDAPQLLFHSIFLVNSVITQERPLVYAGLDFIGASAYVGFTSSTLSLAFGLMMAKEYDGIWDKLIHFGTTALSIGTRALVCASYATSVINGFAPKTWTFLLAPVISISVLIIEDIFIYIFIYVSSENNEEGENSIVVGENDNNESIELKELKKPDKFTVGEIENGEQSIERKIDNDEYNTVGKVENDDNSRVGKNKFCSKKIVIPEKVKTYGKSLLFFSFEANTAQCIISSYTYLAFALSLSTIWSSEAEDASPETKKIFLVGKSFAITSFLLNILIVLWDRIYKIRDLLRCLSYALVYLLYMGGMYFWIKEDFASLKLLYVPTKLEIYEEKDIKRIFSSLIIVFAIAVIIAIIISVMIIINIIKPKTQQLLRRKSRFDGDWLQRDKIPEDLSRINNPGFEMPYYPKVKIPVKYEFSTHESSL